MAKKWPGGDPPTKCDICKRKLKKVFIDGKTKFGHWANMCQACHAEYGYGLGTGKGQLYTLDDFEDNPMHRDDKYNYDGALKKLAKGIQEADQALHTLHNQALNNDDLSDIADLFDTVIEHLYAAAREARELNDVLDGPDEARYSLDEVGDWT